VTLQVAGSPAVPEQRAGGPEAGRQQQRDEDQAIPGGEPSPLGPCRRRTEVEAGQRHQHEDAEVQGHQPGRQQGIRGGGGNAGGDQHRQQRPGGEIQGEIAAAARQQPQHLR
jgi:hypothetical protein